MITTPAGDAPGSSTFVVDLTGFNGPLDLLLALIRDEQVDIYDIPVALICEQFLGRMHQLQLNEAAEYLEMAARLIRIKAQMLLPRKAGSDDFDDPRAELVRRLLEYQQMREVVDVLERLGEDRRSRFARTYMGQPAAPPPAPLALSLSDLLVAGSYDPCQWDAWAASRSVDGLTCRVLVGPWCNPFDLSIAPQVRTTFWQSLRSCVQVNWLLVGHNFDGIAEALPADWRDGYSNVWIGVKASSHQSAARALATLDGLRARVRFLLLEPLLEDLGDLDLKCVDWLVFEEGPDEGAEAQEWFASAKLQAMAYGVPVWSSRSRAISEFREVPSR